MDSFGGVADMPWTNHKYAYGNNSPAAYNDPTGNWAFTLSGLMQDMHLFFEARKRIRSGWSQAPGSFSNIYGGGGGVMLQGLERQREARVQSGWLSKGANGRIMGGLIGSAYVDGSTGDQFYFSMWKGEDVSVLERDVEHAHMATYELRNSFSRSDRLQGALNVWSENSWFHGWLKGLRVGGDPMQHSISLQIYSSRSHLAVGMIQAGAYPHMAPTAKAFKALRPEMAANPGVEFVTTFEDINIGALGPLYYDWAPEWLESFVSAGAGLSVDFYQLMTDRDFQLDALQTTLHVAGFIPGWGIVADLVNAGIYAARGDSEAAKWAAIAAWPGYGELAAAAHYTSQAAGAAVGALENGDLKGAAINGGLGLLSAYGGKVAANRLRANRASNFATSASHGSQGAQGMVRRSQGGKTGTSAGACFVAGTLVKTIHGPVNIEDVKTGDFVWSRDDKSGRESWKRVSRTFVTHPTELVYLNYRHVRESGGDGDSASSDDDKDSQIVGTTEHPFWSVDDNAWVGMGKLSPGDRLLLSDGTGEAIVTATRQEIAVAGTTFTTYNFEVEDTHTYFVSSSDADDGQWVWVHNKCPEAPKTSATSQIGNAGAAIPTNPKIRLPRNNGEWTSGIPGNGFWKSSNPKVNAITNGKPIQFVNGRPVFTPYSKGQVSFNPGQLNGSSNDFDLVYEYIARQKGLKSKNAARTYLKEKGLTPHHLDNINIQLIPTDLHGNIPHIGAASDLRGGFL